MKPRIPAESDLFGVLFFSVSLSPSYGDYHRTMQVLAPLVRADAWREACTGFYLSSVDRIARLSYFAVDTCGPQMVADAMYSAAGLMRPRPPEPPRTEQVSRNYGGLEANFRHYLCTYAGIGLDLFEADLLQVQRLFATYRCQIYALGGAARPHFEPSFLRMSETYRELSPCEQDIFWSGFQSSPGWDHMFVNMVLAVDWRVPRNPAAAVPTNAVLSRFLVGEGLGFDVPDEWDPRGSA